MTWGPVNRELGFSFAILNDSYAAGCGSLAIGSVFLVPFALKFGRRPIYIFSILAQFGFSIWLAKMRTIVDLMLANILSCLVGALAEVMVQMTVADVYFVHQRGLTNTLYYWFMTVGTSLAPLAGGYITNSQGWRWVWWWMAILFGAGLVVFILFYEETMFTRPLEGEPIVDTIPSPTNTSSPTPKEITLTEKQHSVQTTITIDRSIPKKPYTQKLLLWSVSPIPITAVIKHIYEPFILLSTIPAIFFMALEYGILTACITVPVTTLSSVMTLPPYNFGAAQVGLMGIPPFLGTSLGTLICGPLSDWLAVRFAKRNRGVFEPEMRLYLSIACIPFVPAGLFMFGIGLDKGIHWLLPAFGLAVASFGAVPMSSSALTY